MLIAKPLVPPVTMRLPVNHVHLVNTLSPLQDSAITAEPIPILVVTINVTLAIQSVKHALPQEIVLALHADKIHSHLVTLRGIHAFYVIKQTN